MTKDEFLRWRFRLGLTQREAADRLGLTRGTIIDYESGIRRSNGKLVTIPSVVGLACRAIEWGATKYEDSDEKLLSCDDRLHAQWISEMSRLRDHDLELQGRRLFPREWELYPNILIADPEWDDPIRASKIEDRFRDTPAKFEWRSLPVAKHENYGWIMHVRVAAFSDRIGPPAVKIAEKGDEVR